MQEAMDYFQKSLEQSPDNFHAIYNGATLLYETEQYEDAITWFEGARDNTLKFEERKLACTGLGATYEKMKRYKDAYEVYRNEGFAQKMEDVQKKIGTDKPSTVHELTD